MNQERLLKIILAPIRTEKSHRIADAHNQVTFKVLPGATKTEIKKAVKMLFEVDVVSVQVINCRGKRTRMGKNEGWKSNWRKALVRLAPGQDIDFAGGETA